METGITEVFELTGSKGGITVEVAVTERYDALQNMSDVSVGLRVKSSSYYNYTYYLSGSVKVDGTTLVTMDSTIPTHYARPTALNSYTQVAKWSDSYSSSPWVLAGIGHENDGSRSITLEVFLKGYTSGGGGGSGWNVATTRTIALTRIPRASTVGATDANIGAVSIIAVTRRSAEYTHSIGYSFGALTGFLTEAGETAETEQKITASGIAFTVPEDFYAQIPDSPTGRCTLTCKTYWGDTQIGEDQKAVFTVTANKEQCAPVVSGTVADGNPYTIALTGDANVLIRYGSNAVCTMKAAARKSASLVKKTIDGMETEADSCTIAGIRQGSVVFSCTDSRGYMSSVTVEKPLIPYIPITANITAKRTDPTSGNAVLTVTGNYYNGSFGAAENALTVKCRVSGEEYLLTVHFDGGSYRAEGTLTGLNYLTSHRIDVTVADKLQTLTRTVTVGKGIPVFDWGEKDFSFHVPVTAPSINGCRNLALAAYPVGSIYISSSAVSPAELLSGTWEQIENALPGVYTWKRLKDPQNDTAILGVGMLGTMILGKET